MGALVFSIGWDLALHLFGFNVGPSNMHNHQRVVFAGAMMSCRSGLLAVASGLWRETRGVGLLLCGVL